MPEVLADAEGRPSKEPPPAALAEQDLAGDVPSADGGSGAVQATSGAEGAPRVESCNGGADTLKSGEADDDGGNLGDGETSQSDESHQESEAVAEDAAAEEKVEEEVGGGDDDDDADEGLLALLDEARDLAEGMVALLDSAAAAGETAAGLQSPGSEPGAAEFGHGVEANQREDFAAASAWFEESHRRLPRIRTLLSIANMRLKLGEPERLRCAAAFSSSHCSLSRSY